MSAGTLPQHLQALERAKRIRLERAQSRREIAAMEQQAGRNAVAVLLLAAPDHIASATIIDLLTWPRYMGLAWARRILRGLSIYEGRQISELTERQRHII